MRTLDNEIRIKPVLEDTDLKKFENHLTLIEQHMSRIVGLAGKIQIPGGAGSPSGSGGGAAIPTGGGGTNASERATQYAQERMPSRAQTAHRRTGVANASMNSGQFLTNFQNVIQPILPQLDAMMAQPGGPGKSGASALLRQHLSRVQRIAAHPAGSTAESQAILAANQATGVDPGALAAAAAQYRATNPTHGSVINAYLKAQQQAASGSGSGGSGGLGIVKQLAGAAGFGGIAGAAELGGLGAAALGVGFVANQTRQGWSNYMQQGTAFSALSKSVGTLGESFNTLRNTINSTSLGFAETMPQITQAFQAMAPYVGNLGTRGLARMMTASQGFAFGYGLNPASTAQAFGQAAQIGILGTNSTTGQMTPAQWAATIANAVSSGGMQGRQGQVLSAMLGVSQQIAQQIAGAPNQTLLASIMTGLNQSGNPLLQGTMGAQILGNINQGIQNPGLGNAGQLFSYQALNPNGQLGYFQTKYLQAQGLNGINPTTGVSNFAAELQRFQRMLPGGKVQFTKDRYGTIPTEQTATTSALLGQLWGLTQPQALQVMQAFNGQSLSTVNRTTQLAQQWGGPNALQHLLKTGGMNVFAGIANATGVGGKNGLNALAHQVTGTLHGHVSSRFYALEKQYQHLGALHPTSAKQAGMIQHQRAQDFTQMQQALGKSVLGGPTLQTSMDKLNSTVAKNTAAWAKVAKQLQPIVEFLQKGSASLGNSTGTVLHNLLHGGWMNGLVTGHMGATTAYTIPGLPQSTSAGGLSATLASFVQGNQQGTFVSVLRQMLTGSSSGGSSPYQNTSFVTPGGGGPTSAQQAAFVKKMMPYAQKDARATGLPTNFFLTQWADESAFGTSTAAQRNNNFAGIKPWAGAHAGPDSKYAGYSSLNAFAQGVAKFYEGNSNYQGLLQAAQHGASTPQLLQMLGQTGYASSPDYGQTLVSLLSEIRNLLRNGSPNALRLPSLTGI